MSRNVGDLRKSKEWTKLQQIANQVEKTISDHRHIVAHTKARTDVDPKTRAEHVEEVKKQTRSKLTTLEKEMKQAQAALDDQFKRILRPEPDNDTQAMLAELKKAKAWNRVKANLDASDTKDLVSAIQLEIGRAMKANEREAVDALREELPSYLGLKNLDEALPSIEKMVAAADTLFYDDYQKVAMLHQKEFERGAYRSKVALEHGKDALTLRDNQEVVIPAWTEGETVTIKAAPVVKPDLPNYTANGQSVADAAGL